LKVDPKERPSCSQLLEQISPLLRTTNPVVDNNLTEITKINENKQQSNLNPFEINEILNIFFQFFNFQQLHTILLLVCKRWNNFIKNQPFYKTMLKQYKQPKWKSNCHPTYFNLSEDCKTVTYKGNNNEWFLIIGDFILKKGNSFSLLIKNTYNGSIFIGIAPVGISLPFANAHETKGGGWYWYGFYKRRWMVLVEYYSKSIGLYVQQTSFLKTGDKVKVNYDLNGNISFIVNGKDLGIAYSSQQIGNIENVVPAVELYHQNDCVEFIWE
jgi:hypothetical protein